MTRILILGDINSIHIIKWATALTDKGFSIGIYTLSDVQKEWYAGNSHIQVFYSLKRERTTMRASWLTKWKYVTVLANLKGVIRRFSPDIVHAHYASSYGLLGALVGFQPYVISVWGSDVYDFPRKGLIPQLILKYNLSKAHTILSTSHAMAIETARYTNKTIAITPFGVDINVFKPSLTDSYTKDRVTIGTIKTLEDKYGISYLIKAFAIIRNRLPECSLKLLIVGGGSKAVELNTLAQDLGIQTDVEFTGFVDHRDIPTYYQQLDIAVFPSVLDSESFGVAAVEASACGKPVVVSRVGGLPEVVVENETGLVVEPRQEQALADAIEFLIKHKEQAEQLGAAGRKRVEQYYNWVENVGSMVAIYQNILSFHRHE